MSDPQADVDWQLTVPTRRVEADGTAHVVATLVDPATGEEGTVTVRLTADRRLTCSVTGLALADFQAWSDR